MLLDLSLHSLGNDSSEFILRLLVFPCLARPSLEFVAAVVVDRAATVLGVMGPVGSMNLAAVRRFASFLVVVGLCWRKK